MSPASETLALLRTLAPRQPRCIPFARSSRPRARQQSSKAAAPPAAPPAPSDPEQTPPESFTPRLTYPDLPNLPRSYFLGHHAAGLDRMRSMLRFVDLVIECRDARIPFTGHNPILERTLTEQGARRIICYTKRDLAATSRMGFHREESMLHKLHEHTNPAVRSGLETIVFCSHVNTSAAEYAERNNPARGISRVRSEEQDRKKVLNAILQVAQDRWSLTGLRVLVAGMPNVGKSTLLNVLRAKGMHKGKVARTGADPGVTRKVGGWVKVIDGAQIDEALAAKKGVPASTAAAATLQGAKSQSEGVYVADTPGVFMPYVPQSHSMLKLALVGAVKDDSAIIHPVTLVDYLLYHLNLPGNEHARKVYVERFMEGVGPTNDVVVLLNTVARRIGRIGKGNKPDMEGTAVWLVKQWRAGKLGKFALDDISRESIDALIEEHEQQQDGDHAGPVSLSQARRFQKEQRREKSRAKFEAKSAATTAVA